MAQLDKLIEALPRYASEVLELAAGERPAMRIGGNRREVVRTALDAARVVQLLKEIAPPEAQAPITSGGTASFPYAVDGVSVEVRVSPGPKAVIRVVPRTASSGAGGGSAAPAPAPEDAAGADPTAARAEAAAPGATTDAPATTTDAGAMTGAGAGGMTALLRTLFERGGSDLHISSFSVPMMRVDGELLPVEGMRPLEASAAERLLLEIVPERYRRQFEERGDTDFAYEIPGVCRFRCNLFRDRQGPGGVFRVIPAKILTAEELGLGEAIRNLCFLHKGLVLVTGPTGSGKSTTLAALVDLINRRRRDHIITIEDPIEFVHPNRSCLVNQREVGEHTGSFKTALRAALREDPDVVLVGEMRDLETVSIALETAETGHLVFGTLHTSSAVSTVDRLIDQFPADQQAQIRIMLSETLKAVIAQTLCRKTGGGRVAALEVLMVNPAVSNLIREGKTFQIASIMQTGRKLGMVTLNEALLDLVTRKVVEPSEAYAKAVDKPAFASSLRNRGVRWEPAAAQAEPVPSGAG